MHYQYPKIRNIYWRDMEGSKKIIQGQYENDTFQYLAYLPWEATLKLDGMNVGLVWDGHRISWQGRTEKTNFSEVQKETLDSYATPEMEEILEQKFGEETVVIYGELIGPGIQAAGKEYFDNGLSFVVFDVYRPDTDQWWSREAVESLANSLGLSHVPLIATGTLPELVELAREKRKDPMAKSCSNLIWEGLVARPIVEMKDNKARVICKIKVRDVCEEE